MFVYIVYIVYISTDWFNVGAILTPHRSNENVEPMRCLVHSMTGVVCSSVSNKANEKRYQSISNISGVSSENY